MKWVSCCILLLSLSALANSVNLSEEGLASGFCQGGGAGSFCLQNLQNQADQQAQEQGQVQCDSQHGTVEYGGYCSHFCNPPFLNNTPASVFVECNSDCQIECNLEQP